MSRGELFGAMGNGVGKKMVGNKMKGRKLVGWKKKGKKMVEKGELNARIVSLM